MSRTQPEAPLTSAITADSLAHPISVDRERYRGRPFALLLLAVCGPSALLFLRIMLGHAAAEPGITVSQVSMFSLWSRIFLLAYGLAQIVAVWYMARMLPRRGRDSSGPSAFIRRAIQFAGLLITSVIVSIIGAVMLEAFGYSFFLQFRR